MFPENPFADSLLGFGFGFEKCCYFVYINIKYCAEGNNHYCPNYYIITKMLKTINNTVFYLCLLILDTQLCNNIMMY